MPQPINLKDIQSDIQKEDNTLTETAICEQWKQLQQFCEANEISVDTLQEKLLELQEYHKQTKELISLAQEFTGIGGETVVDWSTAKNKFQNTYKIFSVYRMIVAKHLGVNYSGWKELDEHFLQLKNILYTHLGIDAENIDLAIVEQKIEDIIANQNLFSHNIEEVISLAQGFTQIKSFEVQDYESAKRKFINTYSVFQEYKRLAIKYFGADLGTCPGMDTSLHELKHIFQTELGITGEVIKPQEVRERILALKNSQHSR